MSKISINLLGRAIAIFLLAGVLPATNAMISTSNAAAPTFTIVYPSAGSTLGGESVQISGTNFSAGMSVKFGGVNASSLVYYNSSFITVVAPTASAGAVNIVITNSANESVTATNAFTYVTPIQTNGFGGSNWAKKCPAVIDANPGAALPTVYGFQFNGTGQQFSRLTDGGFAEVTSPANLLGCYANLWDFEAFPTTANGYQIGSINRDAVGLYWRNADAAIWRLTLTGSLLTTNAGQHPYPGNQFNFPTGPFVRVDLAVQAAAAAAAAARAAVAAVEAKIAEAKQDIVNNIQSGKTITLASFQDAGISGATEKNIERINKMVTALPESERGSIVNIQNIVTKVKRIDTFFAADAKPSTTDFRALGFPRVTENLIPKILKELTTVPTDLQGEKKAMDQVIQRVMVIDKLSNPETVLRVSTTELVNIGVISATIKNRQRIVNALKSLPADQVDSFEKVKAAVAKLAADIQAAQDAKAKASRDLVNSINNFTKK